MTGALGTWSAKSTGDLRANDRLPLSFSTWLPCKDVYCVCTLACLHLPPTCSSLVVNAGGYVYVSVSPLEQNSPGICLVVLTMYAVISFSHCGVTLHEQWECIFSCLVLLVSLNSFQ